MHAKETMNQKDLKSSLNTCQFRQYPYTFWDAAEVKDFDLASLPLLEKEPEGFKLKGHTFLIDLESQKDISGFKKLVVEYIEELVDSKQEVSFARVMGNERGCTRIQIYIK